MTTNNTAVKATQKLVCAITGDWSYCTEGRHAKLVEKFGSEETLKSGYMSRKGIQLLAENGNDFEKAKAAALQNPGKNKIFDIVTMERMYISPARLAKIMAQQEMTEEEVRASYVGRVPKRLRTKLAAEKFEGKAFAELEDEQKSEIDAEIKTMADEGTLPAPSAPKGSVKEKAPKAEKAGKATTETPAVTSEDVVQVTKASDEQDIMRKIDGESSKDRKNRIRREKRAAAKA